MVLDFFKYTLNDELKTYKIRQTILRIIDILIVISSYSIAIMLTTTYIYDVIMLVPLLIYIIANSISISISRGYSSLWNQSIDREFIQMVIAVLVYQVPVAIVNKSMGYEFPFLFYILNTLLTLLATCLSRVGYRVVRKVSMYISLQTYKDAKNVLIIGAGSAGRLIIKELYENQQLQKKPIGIVDDNKSKIGKKIYNTRVIGTCEDIKSIVENYEVDEIIFSIANIENKRKKEIIEICKSCKCVVKTIPGIYEIIEGKVDIKNIRDVEI